MPTRPPGYPSRGRRVVAGSTAAVLLLAALWLAGCTGARATPEPADSRRLRSTPARPEPSSCTTRPARTDGSASCTRPRRRTSPRTSVTLDARPVVRLRPGRPREVHADRLHRLDRRRDRCRLAFLDESRPARARCAGCGSQNLSLARRAAPEARRQARLHGQLGWTPRRSPRCATTTPRSPAIPKERRADPADPDQPGPGHRRGPCGADRWSDCTVGGTSGTAHLPHRDTAALLGPDDRYLAFADLLFDLLAPANRRPAPRAGPDRGRRPALRPGTAAGDRRLPVQPAGAVRGGGVRRVRRPGRAARGVPVHRYAPRHPEPWSPRSSTWPRTAARW